MSAPTWAKRGILFLLVVIAFCLMLLGLLPSILSTSMGTHWLTNQLAKRTAMSISVDTLQLGWFGSQTLTGLKLKDQQGKLSLSCSQITLSNPLWKVLLQKDIGELHLIAPSGALEVPLAVWSPLSLPAWQQAGLPRFAMQFTPLISQIHGTLRVDEGSLEFHTAQKTPLFLNHIQLNLERSHTQALQGSLSCASLQDAQKGTIALEWSWAPHTGRNSGCDLKATVNSFPVRAIDELVALGYPEYRGILPLLTGPTLDIQGSLRTQQKGAALQLQIDSSYLHIDLATHTAADQIVLVRPAKCTLQLTPALMTKAQTILPLLETIELKAPTTLQVILSQGALPLPLTLESLLELSYKADISLSGPTEGTLSGVPFNLRTLSFSSQSTALSQQLSWKATSSLALGKEGGSIQMEGELSSPLLAARQGYIAIDAKQFPLSWEPTLRQWLGSIATLQARWNMAPDHATLSLAVDSPLLTLPSCSVQSSPQGWTLTAPCSFSYRWTQEGDFHTTPLDATLLQLTLDPERWAQSRLELSVKTEKAQWAGHFLDHAALAINVDTLKKIALKLTSDTLQASTTAALDLKTRVCSLLQPLVVQYNLLAAQLVDPTSIQLSVNPCAVSWDMPWLTPMRAQLFCAQAQLRTTEAPLTLQQCVVPLEWNPKTRTLLMQPTAQIKNPDQSMGTLQGMLQAALPEGKNLRALKVDATIALNNLSSSLWELYPLPLPIESVCGNTFSAQVSASSSAAMQQIDCKWSSPLLTVDIGVRLDEKGLALYRPATFSWEVTPESYRLMDRWLTGQRQPAFSLESSSRFSLTLSQASLPFLKPVDTKAPRWTLPQWHPQAIELVASGNNPSVVFIDRSEHETLAISALTFSCQKLSGSLPVALKCSADLLSEQGAQAKPGSFSLMATFDPLSEAELAALSAQVELHAKQLPCHALDIIARAAGQTDTPFTALFGPTLQLDMTANIHQLTGPVTLQLSSANAHADLQARLDQGVLLLDQPFYGQLMISRDSSRALLRRVNLLDLSAFYSKAPLTFYAAKEGFALPLYPWQPQKMKVSSASIDLGKIACRNEGNVGITLGLLKAKPSNGQQEITLWFAPLDFQVDKGIMNVERTEVLIADQFDICLFGQIDWVKQYVDMVLGLTAQTLAHAFGIKHLPQNYVLTIPLKGNIDHVQINTGKATAKVALLLAWQNKVIEGAFGNSPASAFAGALLGAVATLPDADAKVPPPKHPFPWESGESPRKAPSSGKKKLFKTGDKPIKQIFKVIR